MHKPTPAPLLYRRMHVQNQHGLSAERAYGCTWRMYKYSHAGQMLLNLAMVTHVTFSRFSLLINPGR